jgi:hypothetical protein
VSAQGLCTSELCHACLQLCRVCVH